jgi:predicted acylesterase/phospholipase RssA
MTVSAGPTEPSPPAEHPRDVRCRILSLDGGGAKGFYTLGVLKEIEAMLGCPLHTRFDLIFGTSTGAIIATLRSDRGTAWQWGNATSTLGQYDMDGQLTYVSRTSARRADCIL